MLRKKLKCNTIINHGSFSSQSDKITELKRKDEENMKLLQKYIQDIKILNKDLVHSKGYSNMDCKIIFSKNDQLHKYNSFKLHRSAEILDYD